MMVAAFIEWAFTTLTSVGTVILSLIAREFYKDLVRAQDEESTRLILGARIPFRLILAMAIMLGLFWLIGVIALFRPNMSRDWPELVLIAMFVFAVGQLVWVGWTALRDARHLAAIITDDIRQFFREHPTEFGDGGGGGEGGHTGR